MVDGTSGFPPYHPLVPAQGFDPAKVDIGLRNDTYELAQAGYNVHGEPPDIAVVSQTLIEM